MSNGDSNILSIKGSFIHNKYNKDKGVTNVKVRDYGSLLEINLWYNCSNDDHYALHINNNKLGRPCQIIYNINTLELISYGYDRRK